MASISVPGDGYVRHEGCDHIFFVGFLGVGKTTVARDLGALFNREAVDTDRLIELRHHMSIGELYRRMGDKGYRDAETEVLRCLRRRQSLLVSCGGGAVGRAENRAMIREMGAVVYLEGDLSDSYERIVRLDRRPDLGSPKHAAKLLEQWRPLYREMADITVSVHGQTFEQVAYEVADLLWKEGLL